MKTKMGKYLCEYCPGHPRATKEGYVYTHVLVVESGLGRYLNSEECVHHIDEQKYNNSPDNLMVFESSADHAAFHRGVPAVQKGDVWWCPTKRTGLVCPICSGPKDRKAKLCRECFLAQRQKEKESKKCKKIHVDVSSKNRQNKKNSTAISSVVGLPPRDVLKEQIRTMSFCQVGVIYGVTDNAIRKWCEKYNLPKQSRVIDMIPDDEWYSEILSDHTVRKIRQYNENVVSEDNIINAYYACPNLTTVAEQLHKDAGTIKNVLLKNHIRVLSGSESRNIKVTDQYIDNGQKVNSFLTVMDAAKWILDNGFGRNNHKTKKIAYLISQGMDTNKEVFGFLWKSNNTIEDYREYLTCQQSNIAC